MPNPILKRSIKISGHATSVSLETEFWKALSYIAQQKQVSVSSLICQLDEARLQKKEIVQTNLSSYLRVFILKFFAKDAF